MSQLNDEVKTQFITREGTYRLLNLSEYSRPNRVGYQSNQNSPQVRVSFVSLPQNPSQISSAQQQQSVEKGKREMSQISFEMLLITFFCYSS
jgi:WD repeat-containing protein 20